MRRAAVYGLAVVCVCMLFALSGPSAQRIVNGDGSGGTSSTPVPVSVANFPASQSVFALRPIPITGSVAVTNLPAVQQVAGTVNVGNLPVDADGNVRVVGTVGSTCGALHFVGITTASVSTYYVLPINRACHAEFPGTRACSLSEIQSSIPPPPTWTGEVFIAHPTYLDSVGCLNALGGFSSCSNWTQPVACCGY